MTTNAGPLAGITVIELTDGGVAAELLGRTLVDLGAYTIDAGTGAAFTTGFHAWLRAGKCVATGPIPDLLAEADVLICDDLGAKRLAESNLGPQRLIATCPRLITVQISKFGATGPLSDVTATELTLQALAGITAATGAPDGMPVTSTISLSCRTAALSGLIAVTAGLIGRARGAGGDYLDIAEFDSLLAHLGTVLPSVALNGKAAGYGSNRHSMTAPWNSYPCLDGQVVVCTMGESMWQRLATLIGRPELVDDTRFINNAARVANIDALDAFIGAWTGHLPAQEVVTLLQAEGIPSAHVSAPADVRSGAEVERRDLVDSTDLSPRSPLCSLMPTIHRVGQERQGGVWERITPGTPPLRGIRLLELGTYTAGPLAGRFLAQLGADVLKVEPPQGEGSRRLAQRVGAVGYLYFVNNAGKRSCRLDLDSPRDQARFRELLGTADILLTNLAADTLNVLGISPEQVLADHSIVHCAVTGHGLDAVDRSVDTVIQAESGIMHIVGESLGVPLRTPVSSADVLGACLAAAATLVATLVRLRSAAGASADVALFDSAVWATQDRWFDNQPMRAPQLLTAEDGMVVVDAVTPLPQATDQIGEILKAAADQGVPAAPLYDLSELVRHPHVLARQMIVEQSYEDTTMLITGNHLRSLHGDTWQPDIAPVDHSTPAWRTSTTSEGQR